MLQKFKLSTVFAVIGFAAGMAITLSQAEMLQGMLKDAGESVTPLTLAWLAGLQTAVMTLLFTFFGLLIAGKVNLRLTSALSTPWLVLSVLGGMGGMGVVLLLDIFVFLPRIPQVGSVEVTWWKGLLGGILYGGFFEEVAVRFFLMSAIVWVLGKIIRRSHLPDGVYWVGIVLATILFAAGHLPMTVMTFGELSPILVARAFLLNGLLGIFYGYLYWKRGLAYSMVAHMSSHLFLYGIVKGIIL
jgi:hypothetical protein